MAPEQRKAMLSCFAAVFLIYLFQAFRGSGGFYHLSGDSLCQIAYWKILFRPWLSESLGAAAAKPGQILLLGVIHQYLNPVALNIALAGCGAGLALILGLIAAGIGGTAAGVFSMTVSAAAFLEYMRVGDSNLFLLPILFGGLTLYYYRSPAARKWGLLLLVLTPHFRIEAGLAAGIVLLIHLFKKEWKEFFIGSLALAASMGVWLAVMLRLQGDVSRFASGPAAGYMAGVTPPLLTALANLARAAGGLFHSRLIGHWFFVLAGIAGAAGVFRKYRYYMIAFAPVVIVLVNYIFLGGGLNFTRYFATVYGFGFSVGAGVFFVFLERYASPVTRKRVTALAFALALAALIIPLAGPLPAPGAYIADGLQFCREERVPPGSRVMSEDDVFYIMLMNDPDRLQKFYTLQLFNVSSDSARREILADTDFIYLLKQGHPYYYMFINESQRRTDLRSDLFRPLITEIMRDNSRADIYGVTLVPLVNDEKRLILKVERSAAGKSPKK